MNTQHFSAKISAAITSTTASSNNTFQNSNDNRGNNVIVATTATTTVVPTTTSNNSSKNSSNKKKILLPWRDPNRGDPCTLCLFKLVLTEGMHLKEQPAVKGKKKRSADERWMDFTELLLQQD